MSELDNLRAENTRLNDELYREREAHRRLIIAYAELRRHAENVVVRHRSGFPVVVAVGSLAAHLERKDR